MQRNGDVTAIFSVFFEEWMEGQGEGVEKERERGRCKECVNDLSFFLF